MGFRVYISEFLVNTLGALGLGIEGLGCWVLGAESKVWDLGSRVYDLGSKSRGSGFGFGSYEFRVYDLGFRAKGLLEFKV